MSKVHRKRKAERGSPLTPKEIGIMHILEVEGTWQIPDTDIFLGNLVYELASKPREASDEDIIVDIWSSDRFFERDEVWLVR
jgi:hypothetical protein